MNNLLKLALVCAAGVLCLPSAAAAQITGFDDIVCQSRELVDDHFTCTGDVVLTQPDSKLYADKVDFYPKTNRLIATGNVLSQTKDHQIAADRADFNAENRLGTFYNARGFASLGARADVSQFGSLQPDVQFYGETIEKIGPDRYLISHGGFTTCAQANPRWEMTSSSIKLRVDHYALLKNMWLKAKGVPVLFLPALYYPISSNNRQTGFLMPSYGSSSYRGQVISNGFFWAMGRSRDATILHDWYSKTGQAVSGEYRYLAIRGSGNLNTTFLDEKATTYNDNFYAGQKSFTLNGSLSQAIGPAWYAQGQASYFSSFAVHERGTADLDTNSRRNRLLGGSISGTLHGYRLTGRFDRNEYFNPDGTSNVQGNAPRLNLQRPDRLISRHIPVYASVTNEYVHLDQSSHGLVDGVTTVTNNNMDRLDIQSALRFPYSKLSFMPINTSLIWRNTFWADSLDPTLLTRTDAPLARRYFDMSAEVNGPSFVKIWDSPRMRFKHTLEPYFRITHRTPIAESSQIIVTDSVDNVVGNMTSYDYGGSTRLYAKKTDAGRTAIPREILTATIRQTYSTDAQSILSDQHYRDSNTAAPTHFSPVRIDVRASPTQPLTATFRTQLDPRYLKFQTFGADASWNSERLNLLVGWSEQHFYPDANGINIESALTQYLNSSTTLRFKHNRYGLVHSINMDIHGRDILQQRLAGYYNAQCCGFTAEWQTYDFSRLGTNALVPKDRRFHFSVTLAGIGNVSNIFGALSGTPNR